MLNSNISVNAAGRLSFGGADTAALAKKYGTPLMLLDEERLRANCRQYADTLRECFDGRAKALYASKALCIREVCRIVRSEGLGLDAVSPGELYTTVSAGVPASELFLHGSSKTDDELKNAVLDGIGRIVVDSFDELEALESVCAGLGKRQAVLLRLTPGIDPHTFEAVNTGRIDSKFGVSIGTGQAAELVAAALKMPHIELMGYHCHIGSQIFDAWPFLDAVDIMLRFSADIKASLGFSPEELDLGGGFGVRYVESDPTVDIPSGIRAIAERLRAGCAGSGLKMPYIYMEPGRSIVADAGMTLYTVQAFKNIRGFKNYLTIDGGMTDNPRYALYGSAYTLYAACKPEAPAPVACTVAGRCCESGDIIAPAALLPELSRGDTLAVAVTGAYNYSMASNYNRVCRPPIAAVKNGSARLILRRESFADLTACEL